MDGAPVEGATRELRGATGEGRRAIKVRFVRRRHRPGVPAGEPARRPAREEMRSLQKMDDRFGMWNDVTLARCSCSVDTRWSLGTTSSKVTIPPTQRRLCTTTNGGTACAWTRRTSCASRRIRCEDVLRRWLSIVIVI